MTPLCDASHLAYMAHLDLPFGWNTLDGEWAFVHSSGAMTHDGRFRDDVRSCDGYALAHLQRPDRQQMSGLLAKTSGRTLALAASAIVYHYVVSYSKSLSAISLPAYDQAVCAYVVSAVTHEAIQPSVGNLVVWPMHITTLGTHDSPLTTLDLDDTDVRDFSALVVDIICFAHPDRHSLDDIWLEDDSEYLGWRIITAWAEHYDVAINPIMSSLMHDAWVQNSSEDDAT